MRKILKKVSALTMATAVIVCSTVQAYAYNICTVQNNYVTNAYNLFDEKGTDGYMYQKLTDEKENYSGLISEENEAYLNSAGVFDVEIEDFSEDSLSMLQNDCTISVCVTYIGIDENGNIIEYEADEIDEYFETEGETENSATLQLADVSSDNRAALCTTSNYDSETDNTGMLKQILLLSQYTSGGDITVSYTALWLSMPYYLSTDVFGVIMGNMSPEKSTIQAYYRYKYTQSTIVGTSSVETTVSGEVDLVSKGQVSCYPKYVSAFFEFNHSRNDIIEAALLNTTFNYTTNKLVLYFHATVDDKKSWTYVTAVGDYLHENSSKSITPSISVGSDGWSFSLSASQDKYYSHMTPNVYSKLTFK